jgi:hypothetical protein
MRRQTRRRHKAELPVPRDDVTFEHNVAIEGEREFDGKIARDRAPSSRAQLRKFRRSFTLPTSVDSSKAEAIQMRATRCRD